MSQKVAIVGSRTYSDLNAVREYVMSLAEATEVVSGGARGVDRTAAFYAERRGLKVFCFLPDWERYGKSAGFRRNAQIVESADRVIAFWDGSSAGTKNSIDLALKAGKPVEIHYSDGRIVFL